GSTVKKPVLSIASSATNKGRGSSSPLTAVRVRTSRSLTRTAPLPHAAFPDRRARRPADAASPRDSYRLQRARPGSERWPRSRARDVFRPDALLDVLRNVLDDLGAGILRGAVDEEQHLVGGVVEDLQMRIRRDNDDRARRQLVPFGRLAQEHRQRPL